MASRANMPDQPQTPRIATTPVMPVQGTIDPSTLAAGPTHAGYTQFNTAAGEESVAGERAPIAPGETAIRKRKGEVFDDFYLSPEDLEQYGIPGAIPSCLAENPEVEADLVYVALRAPAVYGKLEPSHIRAKKRASPSMEIVKDKEGHPVYATKDHIYAVVSREEYLKKQARHNKETHSFTKGVIERRMEHQDAAEGVLENFKGSDPEFLMKQREKYHAMLSGIKQNWPRGMSIEQIEMHVGAERTAQIERKYARNGRTEREGEGEKFAALMREMDGGGKKRSISTPGRPTTTTR